MHFSTWAVNNIVVTEKSNLPVETVMVIMYPKQVTLKHFLLLNRSHGTINIIDSSNIVFLLHFVLWNVGSQRKISAYHLIDKANQLTINFKTCICNGKSYRNMYIWQITRRINKLGFTICFRPPEGDAILKSIHPPRNIYTKTTLTWIRSRIPSSLSDESTQKTK